MVSILGVKRIVFILLLVALNVGGGFGYKYMNDTITIKERQLNGLKRKVRDRFNEVKKVREQFAALRGQVTDYVLLEKRGFFEEQDREVLRDIFFEAQKKSQVLRAKYDVSPYKSQSSAFITQPNLRWVNSKVNIKIEALDDIDIFSFVELIERDFPGYVQFESIDLKRNETLTPDVLKKIGSGTPISLVNADVSFLWHSVPETKQEAEATAQ
ncbi:MAG: hypothetical protein VX740_04005 [Pseudomonadota bacterium]|jgi:hypothetical protein|nr:hypothetical protein [Pseudomonadota bacterium]MEC9235931.1 hypothetical protein [Pseudomonadota bacterium]MED5422584.1 hypothetical protein [Pseudomonadota bacterium]MEE3323182.1 hypothetical protein [Pseudomonadota bacterium]|tara:strand:+ start:721 stop:1359 length:639 start_codon:yes stop_codon:yes gene_type:complete